MKNALWFGLGFGSCLVLAVIGSIAVKMAKPHGTLSYEGPAGELLHEPSSSHDRLTRDGTSLPYGAYQIKLSDGKTLVIHKNNRGVASVKETNGLVLVKADENIISADIEP